MLEDNMSLENEQENNLPLTSDVGYNLESAQASALSSLSETAQALTVAINKIAAYVPTQWVNGTEPDIDEDNLNKIEEGIKNATNAVNSSIDAITELAAAVDTLNGNLSTKVSVTNNTQLARLELTTDNFNIFTIYAKRDDGVDYAFWITKSGLKLGAYIDGQWQIFWVASFIN